MNISRNANQPEGRPHAAADRYFLLCDSCKRDGFVYYLCRHAEAWAVGRAQIAHSAVTAARPLRPVATGRNPQTPQEIALGKGLLFDARLSVDNCSSESGVTD